MPPEVTKRGWSRKNHPFWFHTDQSYLRNGFECIQSWVTAQDVKKGDATLAVLEGSHNLHGEFYKWGVENKKEKISNKANWYRLDEEEVNWYTKQCRRVLIRAPQGSQVFWDSRTIHCGFNPLKGRKKARLRCIAYVCMTPRKLCKKKDLEKRIQFFKNRRTTSHWPHRLKVNPEKPRTYGKPLEDIEKVVLPELTFLGRRLVGYEQ